MDLVNGHFPDGSEESPFRMAQSYPDRGRGRNVLALYNEVRVGRPATWPRDVSCLRMGVSGRRGTHVGPAAGGGGNPCRVTSARSGQGQPDDSIEDAPERLARHPDLGHLEEDLRPCAMALAPVFITFSERFVATSLGN